MKFVALISGGKDSCYNAIKCVSYGHELVCMGNLCPPDDFVGEEVNVQHIHIIHDWNMQRVYTSFKETN